MNCGHTRGSWPLISVCVALLGGCDGNTLYLGSDDGGTPDTGRRPRADANRAADAGPSCPFIANDSTYGALRGQTCVGACSGSLSPARDLSQPDMLAASLTSPWTFCSGYLGTPAATGIQFFPGCVLFLLQGDDGGVVGGNQTYDVLTDDAGLATGIVLHLATGDVHATVKASSCLARAELTLDGGVVELSSLEPPNMNPAK